MPEHAHQSLGNAVSVILGRDRRAVNACSENQSNPNTTAADHPWLKREPTFLSCEKPDISDCVVDTLHRNRLLYERKKGSRQIRNKGPRGPDFVESLEYPGNRTSLLIFAKAASKRGLYKGLFYASQFSDYTAHYQMFSGQLPR